MFIERIKYILAVVIYGTIGLFLRYVSLPSEIVALCRGVIGSGFILLYLRAKNQRISLPAIRQNLFWLSASGICLGLNWIFLFAAYMHTTVAIASLCNYMAPVIVILIAPFVLHEPLDMRKIPCVVAALIGIVLVSGAWGGSVGNLAGVFMGFASAVCFVGIVICNRKIHDIPALDKAAFQLAMSALTILPYVLLKNHGVSLEVDLRSILIILMLGVVHTGIAYCFYFSGMGSLPVQTIAILGYLEPVVSVLCSAVFLQEALGIAGWTGAVLVLGAAVVSESMKTEEKKTEPKSCSFAPARGQTDGQEARTL
ncbi:MAG: DMT family transporter [Fretibacterium sp.]|nr:DMT family transporter [Fretibacterium sp.]